jgi:glutamate N-acetyltransferase / amino-acid N-acetyltransferase
MVTIKIAQGFKLNGINCGIKQKKDIGFIVSDRECSVAGVTTSSTTAAACVHYNRKIIQRGKARMLIVNSGNANAFTGEQGEKDVLATAAAAATEFGQNPADVLVASTGIIGKKLPMDKILKGIEDLMSLKESDIFSFSEAIRTTDLTDKIISRSVECNGKTGVITGVAKGSGMIHPQMATMLAFVMTDIAFDSTELQQIVSEINDRTFNMISVDGDTSTNDMVIVMSNAASGLSYQDCSQQIKEQLTDIFTYLAKEIARDGEGAEKLIEVQVSGAADLQDAEKAARSVSRSPLVKTAVHGENSNIGRVVAAIGAAGVAVDMQQLKVSWQGLQTKEVLIKVDLGIGQNSATAWGCDLSKQYIEINTDYN